MLAESRFLGRILLSNVKRLNFPYKLSFCITYQCNLKCTMCFIWKKPLVPELSTEEIDKFFQKSNDFSWVGLTGGEIFLRKDLLEIVAIVIKRCKHLSVLHFPTNGYLKNDILNGVEKMLKLRPKRLFVTVSVDGPRLVHDKVRGVSGSWQNAVDVFIALKKMSPIVQPYLSMTISAGNVGRVEETVNSIKEVYPEFSPETMMNFNVFAHSSHYFANGHIRRPGDEKVLNDVRQAMAVIGQGNAVKNYLQQNYLRNYEQYLNTGRSPLPCQVLSASCFLNPYGDVYPCSAYDKVIGNIKDFDYDLKKLWARKDVEELHHACKKGECPGCWSPCDAYQSINGSLVKSLFSGKTLTAA